MTLNPKQKRRIPTKIIKFSNTQFVQSHKEYNLWEIRTSWQTDLWSTKNGRNSKNNKTRCLKRKNNPGIPLSYDRNFSLRKIISFTMRELLSLKYIYRLLYIGHKSNEKTRFHGQQRHVQYHRNGKLSLRKRISEREIRLTFRTWDAFFLTLFFLDIPVSYVYIAFWSFSFFSDGPCSFRFPSRFLVAWHEGWWDCVWRR